MKAPVYVDSPLAISATEVFRQNTDLFDDEIKEELIAKIKKEDLPEDYIRIMSRTHWYLWGHLKTSGIVDMKYEMRKINHLFKDDYLHISYHEPLRKEQITRGYWDYVNYDVCICGSDIIPVLLAAEKYSGYDLTEIKKQIEEKRVWYKENCYDDYYRHHRINSKNIYLIMAIRI